MLKISRLTDYATMILVHLATRPERVSSASDIAESTHVALPTTQKVLKLLARSGLVVSARGSEGGYALGRSANAISASDILDVLEGPIAITECSATHSHCELESLCQVGGAWQKINKAIRAALGDITLADLCRPARELPVQSLLQKVPRSMHRSERS
ncbi:MAG: SUF system Fe-S cluster assembly regulator [Gammaproteobacteria bacterium]|nr:SUF system Fe-S cluster assembly regulator [Gammaproteobacteria bacterium]